MELYFSVIVSFLSLQMLSAFATAGLLAGALEQLKLHDSA
jgi:hypothetical protein